MASPALTPNDHHNGPHSEAPSLCSGCQLDCSKYTCPRCGFKSCSLACSKAHKLLYSCSGVRDPVVYIPMNRYGWGSMMGDYTYLEKLGRKAGDWGQEIAKGGYGQRKGRGKAHRQYSRRGEDNTNHAENGDNTVNGEASSKHSPLESRKGQAPQGTKLATLQLHLRSRDIRVDFLPEGMERRKLNQSTWDVKTRSGFLTVELLFHKPQDDTSTSSVATTGPVFSLLTHRNALNQSLRDLILKQLTAKSGRSANSTPSWIQHLFPKISDPKGKLPATGDECLGDGEDSLDLLYVMEQLPPCRPHRMFHRLDPIKPLSALLQNRYFIEWPIIEIYATDQFEGRIVGQEYEEALPPAKRRKLNTNEGMKLLNGMLGDYASDDDGSEQGSSDENDMAGLAQYASGDDSEVSPISDSQTSPTKGG